MFQTRSLFLHHLLFLLDLHCWILCCYSILTLLCLFNHPSLHVRGTQTLLVFSLVPSPLLLFIASPILSHFLICGVSVSFLSPNVPTAFLSFLSPDIFILPPLLPVFPLSIFSSGRPLQPVITPILTPLSSILPHLSSPFSYMLVSHTGPYLSPLILLPTSSWVFIPIFLQYPYSPSFSLLQYPPDSTRAVSPLSPPLFPTAASLWLFPRRLDAEGGGWRGDGWPLGQLIGNSLIYGQALPRPNGFISFCRHMMSQPRSPQQRPPFVVVSLADDLRGMEGWRERERVMKEGTERGLWGLFAEAGTWCMRVCRWNVCVCRNASVQISVWKMCFYCFSFSRSPKVSFILSLPHLHFLSFFPLLFCAQ